MCAGLLGSALPGSVSAAMATFAVTGAGNGLFIVSDRVLIQRLVADRFHGRAFGLLDALDSWGFAGAVVAGGALAGAAGGRVTFAVAGGGATLVALAAVGALRRAGALSAAPLLRAADCHSFTSRPDIGAHHADDPPLGGTDHAHGPPLKEDTPCRCAAPEEDRPVPMMRHQMPREAAHEAASAL